MFSEEQSLCKTLYQQLQKICPDRMTATGASLSYKPTSYMVAGGFNLLCIHYSVYFGSLAVGKLPNLAWVIL
jgi:hypothetical protein